MYRASDKSAFSGAQQGQKKTLIRTIHHQVLLVHTLSKLVRVGGRHGTVECFSRGRARTYPDERNLSGEASICTCTAEDASCQLQGRLRLLFNGRVAIGFTLLKSIPRTPTYTNDGHRRQLYRPRTFFSKEDTATRSYPIQDTASKTPPATHTSAFNRITLYQIC